MKKEIYQERKSNTGRNILIVAALFIIPFLLLLVIGVLATPKQSNATTPISNVATYTAPIIVQKHDAPRLYGPISDFFAKYGENDGLTWWLDKQHTINLQASVRGDGSDKYQGSGPYATDGTAIVTQITVTLYAPDSSVIPIANRPKAPIWSMEQQRQFMSQFLPLHSVQIALGYQNSVSYTQKEYMAHTSIGAVEFRMYTTDPSTDTSIETSLQYIA